MGSGLEHCQHLYDNQLGLKFTASGLVGHILQLASLATPDNGQVRICV